MSDDKHIFRGTETLSLKFKVPHQIIFVYPDYRQNVFDDIVKIKVARTGCYVMTDTDGIVFVVRPNHDYVIEKPQPA